MKYRKGLVSNSSSSSFIVIQETEVENIDILQFIDFLAENTNFNGIFTYCPESEFGHQFEAFNDWRSKFDWSLLQIWYIDDELWKEKFLEFLQMYNPGIQGFKIIEHDEDHYRSIGYIDHESVGEDNAIYLCSTYEIKQFILSRDSWICNQSDNYDSEWVMEDGKPVKHKWESSY